MDRDLEEKVRENPSTRLFAPLADTYRKKGRIEEAIEILVQGLSHHPLYISARILLARCYEDLGEWGRAREEWQSVLNLDNRSLVAMKAMGEIDRLLGDLDKSREWFRRYLDEFPGDDTVREKLSQIEDESAPTAVRDRDNETAPGMDPKTFHLNLDPPSYSNGYEAGEGEDFSGEVDSSLAEIDEEEDSVETITLAEIYAQQGFYERAIDIYNRILVHDAENEQIVRRIDELTGKLDRKLDFGRVSGDGSEQAMPDDSPVSPEEEGVEGEEHDPGKSEFDQEIDGPVEMVDINRANVLDLELIPGIGPVLAQKIVIERERNGPFISSDELERVPGLGERLIERIIPYLIFEESSSAREATPAEVTAREEAPSVDAGTEETSSGEEIVEERVDRGGDDNQEGVESEFEDFRRWLKNLRK